MSSKAIQQFAQLLKKQKKILFTTHLVPDADGMGAEIAMVMAMRSLGKESYAIHEESVLERYKYLDPDDCLISIQDYFRFAKSFEERQADALILVDTHQIDRAGKKLSEMLPYIQHLGSLDHHPTLLSLEKTANSKKKKSQSNPWHLIDTTKAATCELAACVIKELGVKINLTMARALYTGILIDTSSFRYPTVTGDTHAIVAELMNLGLGPEETYNLIYGTKNISHMHLLGEILSSSQTSKDKSVAWITLGLKQLHQYKIDMEDTLAFINHLLVLDQVKIACMFTELSDELVKVSLRTGDKKIDVGEIARSLGGGGHGHSAAAIIKGQLNQVVPKVTKKIVTALKAINRELL